MSSQRGYHAFMPVRRTREDKVRAGQRRAYDVSYTTDDSETAISYTIPPVETRAIRKTLTRAPLAYDVSFILADLRKTFLISLFIIGLQLALYYYLYYS